jgi:hypothetical protein
MIVRVDNVPYRAVEPPFDKRSDTSCFFGKNKRIDQDRAFGSNDYASIDLRVGFTGKDVNIVSNTLALHVFYLICPNERVENDAEYRIVV